MAKGQISLIAGNIKMKKLFIILLSLSAIANAQDTLKPIAEFEAGYGGLQTEMYYDGLERGIPALKRYSMYSNLIFGLKYKNFTLRNNLYTYFDYHKSYQFSPWMAAYEIELSYTYKIITIGANHKCIHEVHTPNELPYNYSGGHEHVYVRFKIK